MIGSARSKHLTTNSMNVLNPLVLRARGFNPIKTLLRSSVELYEGILALVAHPIPYTFLTPDTDPHTH